MKIKSIKNFLDCKESIIRVEIVRYLLNQESGKMADDVFSKLWIETDIALSKEINKLKDMLTDDLSDYETLNQLTELITDKVTIKDIIQPDDDLIPVDEISAYIKQDIYERLPA